MKVIAYKFSLVIHLMLYSIPSYNIEVISF